MSNAPDRWLIHKQGRGWYRPEAKGYTMNPDEAGRYTYKDAMSYSHPNGHDGPRDGITIKHESELPPSRADLLEAERARVKELEEELREASKEINTTEMALQHLAGRFVKASVYDAERARADRLEAERDALRECLRPFAATFERYPGFSDYALFGVWEDVNGAAGRKLNILRKQDFDNARDALGDGK